MAKIFEPSAIYGSVLNQKLFNFSVRIAELFKYLLQKDRSFESP